MILGAQELFLADELLFQVAKFLDHQVDHLSDGFLRRSCVYGHHPGIGIGRQLAEHRIGEP